MKVNSSGLPLYIYPAISSFPKYKWYTPSLASDLRILQLSGISQHPVAIVHRVRHLVLPLLQQSASDHRVRDRIVDAAEIDKRHRDDDDSDVGRPNQGPNVWRHQRPPLNDEDRDEDEHHLGGVDVVVGPGAVHPLGGPCDLDPDGSVRDRYDDERYDLGDGHQLAVHLTGRVS